MFFSLSKQRFIEEATRGLAGVGSRGRAAAVAVPLGVRLLSDQLTPVLAYRRMVVQDQRTAPSFLLESVEGGERQGRHSILGAHPVIEVVAREHKVRVTDRRGPSWNTRESDERDPLLVPEKITGHLTLHLPSRTPGDGPLPSCFLGGWAGFAGYDTVRYAEPEKLPFSKAPADDRKLPDLHFGFYDEVVIFDHVDKAVHIVRLVEAPAESTPESLGTAYDHACAALERTLSALQTHSKPLPPGVLDVGHKTEPGQSNMTREDHALMLEKAREYIKAGDIFQVVLGQRFERRSKADPFDVYRALRAVNPSPYMAYMQCEGCILVASSPEILCRVRRSGEHFVLTNRPLAGTRRRGDTPEHDLALERELLADEKERSEHIMLVDLGRNDVGVVARPGTVRIPHVMEIERYSHVMHISSTVTGELREGVGCWEALRACLPVGTISGAPKIRAMQIIDELEPIRRGPYGGGLGYAGLNGEMDIALALRTIVVPTSLYDGQTWTYHLQASGGIVADSQAEPEFMETVNKAAALVRAIDVAERAFAG
jgi:anthranilate synthase component 1